MKTSAPKVYPHVGRLGARYRLARRHCSGCDTYFMARVYANGSSRGLCNPCCRVYNEVRAGRMWLRTHCKVCAGPLSGEATYCVQICAACKAAWKCSVCGRKRPERKPSRCFAMCQGCDRAKYRAAKGAKS